MDKFQYILQNDCFSSVPNWGKKYFSLEVKILKIFNLIKFSIIMKLTGKYSEILIYLLNKL